MRKTIIMYPQTTASTLASDSSQSDSTRYTVADILSSMASTPSTLGNFEGFSTGVLTQTTPTLTPTTLRNIEQTFIELQTVPPQQIQHQNQAGFVTPIVNPPVHSTASNSLPVVSAPSSISPPASTYHSVSTKSYSSESSSNSGSSPPWSQEIHPGPTTTRKVTGRNMGGRRPAKHEKLSPEEEERRRVRRERNKLAAARCRKRRLDHTNCLVHETNILEGKRSELQEEIRNLNMEKDELEFVLETHKVVCKMQKHGHNHSSIRSDHQETADVKPVLSKISIGISSSCPTSSTTSLSSSTSTTFSSAAKPQQSMQPAFSTMVKQAQRPTSLSLKSTFLSPRPPAVPNSTAANSGKSFTEETGIVISTPSNGIFNYDALMEGGTGLTPVSSGTGLTPLIPNCSTQQRSSGSDLASPDTITPTNKLVSL